MIHRRFIGGIDFEKEALKAQAVCARTYAYKQMEKAGLKKCQKFLSMML